MEACPTRWGPDIRRAFGNRIELAKILGSLLGANTCRWSNQALAQFYSAGKMESMSKDGRFRIDL